MTELETIMRAKEYIDKMANGVNPLTDEAVNDNDMINNVRISRCLFYVSKILDRVILNDGLIGSSKRGRSRKDFFITEEQQKNLKAKDFNIYVSEIAEEINKVTGENCTRRMQPAWINNWLLSVELLTIIDDKKHATEQGIQIGILTQLRSSLKHGDYYVNQFSPAAQEFIYDNIECILAHHYDK